MSEKKFYQLPPLPASFGTEEVCALWKCIKMSANDQEITKEYLEALLADFDYKTDIDSNSDLFFDNNVIKDDDPVQYFLEQIKRLSARIMHETCSITSYVYLQHCVYEVPFLYLWKEKPPVPFWGIRGFGSS